MDSQLDHASLQTESPIITEGPTSVNQDNVESPYENEEILVDSDKAREDVKRLLRNELTRIRADFGFNLQTQWPSEQDFWKLAKASGGLLAFAQTVTKYIGDPHTRNPKSQLDNVLKVIDTHPLLHGSQEHPMALLDALYAHILSKVPLEAKSNMRKLLLAITIFWDVIHQEDYGNNFTLLCNWLGITSDDAYAAVQHLFSVLNVPRRDEAHRWRLGYFHESFIDYIRDFARSGFSPDIEQEAQQLNTECAFRVLNQAPDALYLGDIDCDVWNSDKIYVDDDVWGEDEIGRFGALLRGTESGCGITLTWSVGVVRTWDDNKTRAYMYKMAIASILEGVKKQQKAFCNVFCIRFLATRFECYFYRSIEHLHQVVFDQSRCHEFMEQGLVKRVPVKALNFSRLIWKIELRFNRPTMSSINIPDLWNPSCNHERQGQWGQDKPQAWTTQFDMYKDESNHCDICWKRLEHQLRNWQTKVPDHPVLVLFTSAGQCFVEFKFVDDEDGVSEWTYWLVHEFTEEKRKELGSTV